MTSAGDQTSVTGGPTHRLLAHHRVQTSLTLYTSAVDSREQGALGGLLAAAELDFRGTRVSGRTQIAEFYGRAFSVATTATLHHVVRLQVRLEATGFDYEATFQRWRLDGAAPVCIAVGRYSGEFAGADPSTARWTRHVIN